MIVSIVAKDQCGMIQEIVATHIVRVARVKSEMLYLTAYLQDGQHIEFKGGEAEHFLKQWHHLQS